MWFMYLRYLSHTPQAPDFSRGVVDVFGCNANTEILTENRVCAAEEGYCETASVFQAFFHIEIESLDWHMGALLLP